MSNVVKNKRGLSSLELYHTAIDLRKNITELLLRDFGIRNKVRKLDVIVKDMSDEDKKIFKDIFIKYNLTNISKEHPEIFNGMSDTDKLVLNHLLDKYTPDICALYPEWLVDKMRNNIMNLLYGLIMNITAANSIYPTSVYEYHDRRKFQNHAICNCEQLLQGFQYIISVIPVNANKYLQYVDMIEKEIALLKGWRKGDNRLLKKIVKEESKKDNDLISLIKKLVERLEWIYKKDDE